MTAALPVVRELGASDVDAVVHLANLCEVEETGEADPELADWFRGGVSTATIRLFGVEDDDGLVAFAAVECIEGLAALEAEARVRPGRDRDLAAPALAAARRAAADFDADKPVHMFANSAADGHRRWLEGLGGREIRHFWRMAIDLDDAPPAAVRVPDGFTVRPARTDETERRTVFEVVDTAFVDHFGHTDDRTYERWLQMWQSRAGFDPSLWWVAEGDGAIVAACLGMTFCGDDGLTTGHVGTLGTLAEARGRGIGTALLRTAFAEFHRRGHRRVTLGVDSENTTGAVRLYESVGMRAVADWALYELPPYQQSRADGA